MAEHNKNFKIVPAVEVPNSQKIIQLQQFLGANVDIAIEDGELAKAAQFQQHLDTVKLLVEQSRDRIQD